MLPSPWTCPTYYRWCSVAQLYPTLCDPMDYSAPGFPVLHHLPEFTQTHVHWVGNAIQPSHPLSSPSPPAFNLSQHQGCFQWVSSSNQVTRGLEFGFSISPSNEDSSLISFRIDWFDLLARPGDSQESSPAPQFESINYPAISLLYGPTLTSLYDYWRKHSFDYKDFCQKSDVSAFQYSD